jgi:hypothetical protein
MTLARVTGLALAAALGVGSIPAARAEDAPADVATQAKALVAEIDAAEKAKDEQAIATATKRASPLYKATQDGAIRSSIAKALGGVVKNAKVGTFARRAALAALVETEDGQTAWKALSSAFPAADSDDPEKFNADVVRSIGLLHPDGAIDPLLELFQKAKQSYLSAEAVKALGNYGKSKHRERIVLEVVKAGKNMVPSKSKTQSASAETTARWGEVSGAIGQALDGITGQKIGDPIEWFKRVDEAKKNLKSLFKE